MGFFFSSFFFFFLFFCGYEGCAEVHTPVTDLKGHALMQELRATREESQERQKSRTV